MASQDTAFVSGEAVTKGPTGRLRAAGLISGVGDGAVGTAGSFDGEEGEPVPDPFPSFCVVRVRVLLRCVRVCTRVCTGVGVKLLPQRWGFRVSLLAARG